MTVDFHTHTFPEKIAAGVLDKLQKASCSKAYTKGTNDSLQQSMQSAGIDYSVILPVMTNERQVEKLNNIAAETNAQAQQTGLISFGGMHPNYSGYKSELSRIQSMGIKGIKLHPAYQRMDLDSLPFMRIIDRASELGLAVMVHAGIDIGIPNHNYSSPEHIIKVMREVQPRTLILAHMGGWRVWDEVENKLAGLPLYMDTAFVLGKIIPPYGMKRKAGDDWMLSDEQFVRIVKKHGADKILFATDSPWSAQRQTIEHIRSLSLSDSEKADILGENAARLLNIQKRK